MPKRQRFSDFLWQKRLLHSGDAGGRRMSSHHMKHIGTLRGSFTCRKRRFRGPKRPA